MTAIGTFAVSRSCSTIAAKWLDANPDHITVDAMRRQGQPWRYRIKNSDICVDNACSWSGWAQERWIIQGQTESVASCWSGMARSSSEPWLTPFGDGFLKAELR